MRSVRRSEHTARLEMTPLIDVVFLLLTFFIFSWFMMVRAEILPVQIVALAGGERPAASVLNVVTINRQGEYFFNRESVTGDALNVRLSQMARDPAEPTLYITVEERGDIDRAPKLVELLERVREAGVRNVSVVGRPNQ